MKNLGIILGLVFVIVASPFVVQYGWNEIITTIVPVGRITVWQAFGMDVLLSFIFPVLSSKKRILRGLFICCKKQYFKNHYMCIFYLDS